jgi:hypothetical protein
MMISAGEEQSEFNPKASIPWLSFHFSFAQHDGDSSDLRIFGIVSCTALYPGDMASISPSRSGWLAKIFFTRSLSLFRVFADGRILYRTGFERQTSTSPIALGAIDCMVMYFDILRRFFLDPDG